MIKRNRFQPHKNLTRRMFGLRAVFTMFESTIKNLRIKSVFEFKESSLHKGKNTNAFFSCDEILFIQGVDARSAADCAAAESTHLAPLIIY